MPVFAAELRLTRLEQRLLSVLQENAGQCVPRPFLLRTVWGYDERTRTRTVDVHIRHLRMKLGEQAECIKTVLGCGYFWLPNGGTLRKG